MSTLDDLETKLTQVQAKKQRLTRELIKLQEVIDGLDEDEKLIRRQLELYPRVGARLVGV